MELIFIEPLDSFIFKFKVKMMETKRDINEEAILNAIHDLKENINITMDKRFSEMECRFQKVDDRFQKIDDRFQKMENRLEGLNNKIDYRFEEMESDLFTKIEDGINKYASTVKYIKNYILDHNNGFRPARPFSQQTVIPRSISTYTVQKIPSKSWDPPGWEPK